LLAIDTEAITQVNTSTLKVALEVNASSLGPSAAHRWARSCPDRRSRHCRQLDVTLGLRGPLFRSGGHGPLAL